MAAIPWPTSSLDARTRTISTRSILPSMMGDGLFGSWLMARLVSDPILEYKDEKNRLKVSRGVNILDGFETTSAGAPPAARVCL